MPKMSRRKRLTCTSIWYSAYKVLNPWPQHTVQSQHCAETGQLEVQLAAKQKRTGNETRYSCKKHSQIVEMFHECCRIVADVSQNAGFLFCFCFVSLVWTWPKASKAKSYPEKPRFWTFALRSTCWQFRQDSPAAVGPPCCVWAGIPKFSLSPHLSYRLWFLIVESSQNSLNQTHFWWHVDRQRRWLTVVILQEPL